MPASALPAYTDEVPTYEVDTRGQFHIGIGALTLVMPVSVFIEGSKRGDIAIAEWHAGMLGDHYEAEIIPIRPTFERVYNPRGHI